MKNKYLFAATLLLAGVNAMAQPGGGGSPFGNSPLQIEPVRDGIYRISSGSSGNITVFTSDDGVLLVDTKFDNDYDGYMELLRTVTDQPVKYVINTHMHPDHTGGNIRLEGQGAGIVATENARVRLAEAQQTGLPSITFDDHMRLYFGGRAMDLYWFGRGHTDGDLIIHLPDENLVLTGDLFAGGDPFVRPVDTNAGGSLKEWSLTIERALQLDFDTVIPGHSEVTDRARLRAFQDETIRIQEFIIEMVAAGRAPADVRATLEMEFSAMAIFVFGDPLEVIAEFE